MADSGILIRNWDKLQHFKDRDPIWIKLYRALRHNRRWRQLSGDGCKLYIDLMLLAAEDEPFGTIQLTADELGWEVRLDPENLRLLLLEVAAAGLVTVVGYQPDIKMITAGNQEDIPHALARGREEGEVEREKETTNGQRDYDQFLYLDPVEWARFGRDFGVSQEDLDSTVKLLQ